MIAAFATRCTFSRQTKATTVRRSGSCKLLLACVGELRGVVVTERTNISSVERIDLTSLNSTLNDTENVTRNATSPTMAISKHWIEGWSDHQCKSCILCGVKPEASTLQLSADKWFSKQQLQREVVAPQNATMGCKHNDSGR
uniref:Uncharacterized protein n=1 Tax=Glossina austeni TaxID=7395 RepID=A0A1A9ULR2_GLOAU